MKYDEWHFSAPKEFTRYGNPKPPSKPLMLQWIKSAWDLVTPEIVKKSFKKCGISNAMDGTEDNLFNQNDDDEPFKGFQAADVEDEEVYNANVQPGQGITELDSD